MITGPTPHFVARYSRCADPHHGLGLRPVSTGVGVDHAGFDQDEVEKALGAVRFEALMNAIVKGEPYTGRVFSCGHRKDEKGIEVHCIYADDLERFLESEGK